MLTKRDDWLFQSTIPQRYLNWKEKLSDIWVLEKTKRTRILRMWNNRSLWWEALKLAKKAGP
jgi:hypothetical protein